MKKVLLNYFGVFNVLFQLFSASAQFGCTDPQAQNYDLNALVNNGSCEYLVTSYSLQLIANLTGELDENSGLIYSNERLFSINDGGNGTQIQELSLQGNVLRTIHVDSTQNTDWEAITQSESDLFIGDFGNNSGNRTNLNILKINKYALQNFDTVQASVQHFYYSDQVAFNNTVNQHNFDCEAFFFYQDSLHLFTKGWGNLYTKHYVLPTNNQDSVVAQLRDSLFVDGLITDASIDSTTGRILLLGYKNNGSNFYTSFVYLLFDYSQHFIFSGNKRRIEIGNMLTVSQTEGITFADASSGYISAEKIATSILTVSPKLFHFDFTPYFENPISSIVNISDFEVKIYPNPATEYFQFSFSENMQQFDFQIKDYLNRVIIDQKSALNQDKFDSSHLQSGVYFVELVFNQKTKVIPFTKY
jgi:hypothetical protein